ncbi:hypothetical protein V5O48_001692 [Marasmius crinis-equi]|uniref:Uncharacterized protein n=1 Tax=Marasmius crinis-equi TaxID=585013 RepID=A0ABR3FXU8_9AGAR
MSVSVQAASTSATTSAIRRKPKYTYQSPLPTDIRDPATLITYSKTHTQGAPTSSHPVPPTTTPNSLPSFSPPKPKKYFSNTSLPLYHPFGPLALSLPPLDPTKYGLPLLPKPDTELLAAQQAQQLASSSSNGNKSWRGTPTGTAAGSRRDTSVVTATEDGGPPSATAVTEPKEKPSPRKRRNGGGGGGSRRKRKEVDEDASYPATNKRPRYPRGTAASASANAEEDVTMNTIGGIDNPDGSGIGGADEEKSVVERRTTRSRTVARRDSTASETTSVSNSVSASATRAASTARKEEGELAGGETALNNKRRSRSKEEGEVSEESK